ncbi:DUF1830 domain-containing protein [Kamptonema formosum]|uniref:DUF1830 domain-containing protein n=1 Tax=Kamptonema formosum TaxID=331992 RepID=UPI00034B63C3|nr:DUF1830 domain-containing protein [Oscillatoria sp. PCC 10802]
MVQILDPIPAGYSGQILCCYVNATSKIQIARITNIPNWYFERVVFPGQRLVFEAFPEALLEIHTGMMASAILSDKIPCQRLRISEGNDATAEPAGDLKQDRINVKPETAAASKSRTPRPLAAAALTSVD